MTRQPDPPLAADTTPEAQRFQVRAWRRMSPLEKAQAVRRISRAVRGLSLTGIRSRYPAAGEREQLLRYALLTLGPALARAAYPDAEPLSTS